MSLLQFIMLTKYGKLCDEKKNLISFKWGGNFVGFVKKNLTFFLLKFKIFTTMFRIFLKTLNTNQGLAVFYKNCTRPTERRFCTPNSP